MRVRIELVGGPVDGRCGEMELGPRTAWVRCRSGEIARYRWADRSTAGGRAWVMAFDGLVLPREIAAMAKRFSCVGEWTPRSRSASRSAPGRVGSAGDATKKS